MIDTDTETERLRARSLRRDSRELLIARLGGSGQEPDLTEPVNCRGLGRIRHFGHPTAHGWPRNPLPQEPARAHLLGLGDGEMRAQVFQNSACNWRCWYCYVPFNLLGAHESLSEWITADELVDLWLQEPEHPPVLDISGGQPDLIPEWVLWTLQALTDRNMQRHTYVWSDDNLSSDMMFRQLTDSELSFIADYPNYGRAICFKGIDPESFKLNTDASPELFARQFDLAGRLIDLGIDVYAYVTFPTLASPSRLNELVSGFTDRLQAVHELLPLRTIPLEVGIFGPVGPRMKASHHEALERQHAVVNLWQTELRSRFGDQTEIPICDVQLR